MRYKPEYYKLENIGEDATMSYVKVASDTSPLESWESHKMSQS